jgi:hypothetical protein
MLLMRSHVKDPDNRSVQKPQLHPETLIPHDPALKALLRIAIPIDRPTKAK